MTANMLRALELQEEKRKNREKEKQGWVSTFLDPISNIGSAAIKGLGSWKKAATSQQFLANKRTSRR